MDQTAWALLAIRTRARRAEFARLFRRPAGAHDRVVALRTRRHRRWYFMYAASEDRIMYGERYDGPGNGDGHHHRNCALEIARRARGTNRFIFSALRPRRARRRSRTPAPRPPRRRRPPRTRQARTRRARRAPREPDPGRGGGRSRQPQQRQRAYPFAYLLHSTAARAVMSASTRGARVPPRRRRARPRPSRPRPRGCTRCARRPTQTRARRTPPMNWPRFCTPVFQHEFFAQKFYRGAVLQPRVATRRAFRRCHSQSMSAKEGETTETLRAAAAASLAAILARRAVLAASSMSAFRTGFTDTLLRIVARAHAQSDKWKVGQNNLMCFYLDGIVKSVAAVHMLCMDDASELAKAVVREEIAKIVPAGRTISTVTIEAQTALVVFDVPIPAASQF